MKKSELIKKLNEIPGDFEVFFEYSQSCRCTGDDQYCYCSEITESRNVEYVMLRKDGTIKKKNGRDRIVIEGS